MSPPPTRCAISPPMAWPRGATPIRSSTAPGICANIRTPPPPPAAAAALPADRGRRLARSASALRRRLVCARASRRARQSAAAPSETGRGERLADRAGAGFFRLSDERKGRRSGGRKSRRPGGADRDRRAGQRTRGGRAGAAGDLARHGAVRARRSPDAAPAAGADRRPRAGADGCRRLARAGARPAGRAVRSARPAAPPGRGLRRDPARLPRPLPATPSAALAGRAALRRARPRRLQRLHRGAAEPWGDRHPDLAARPCLAVPRGRAGDLPEPGRAGAAATLWPR